MGKLVSWIVLGLFVVIVPLGSWFYLKKGLDFRRTALAELKVKDSLDLSLDTLNIFKGNLSLLVAKSSADVDRSLISIKDQFKNVIAFKILEANVNSPYSLAYLEKMGLKDTNSLYTVVDTFGHVRSYYPDNSIESLRKLVEHVAIIMPKAKEMDIQFKK